MRSIQSAAMLYLAGALLIGSAGAATAPTAGDRPTVASELPLDAANQFQPLLLDVDDSVKMAVLGHPELTHVATVQNDGSISLPLIGEVRAKGRSVDDVRVEVTQRLGSAASSGPATLRTGDQLRMTVWRHPELSIDSVVRPDGFISLPLAGELSAKGKTVAALNEEVRQKLAGFIREPQVTLVHMNPVRNMLLEPRVSLMPERIRDRTVAVIGEVLVPGLIAYKPRLRIMDVLAAARYKDGAELNDVVLIRNIVGDSPQYRMLHIEDFIDGKANDQNVYLQPDDIIVVPKSTITKIGDFIDKFFTRTRPVFDWWKAAIDARYAKDSGELIRKLNENLLNP